MYWIIFYVCLKKAEYILGQVHIHHNGKSSSKLKSPRLKNSVMILYHHPYKPLSPGHTRIAHSFHVIGSHYNIITAHMQINQSALLAFSALS